MDQTDAVVVAGDAPASSTSCDRTELPVDLLLRTFGTMQIKDLCSPCLLYSAADHDDGTATLHHLSTDKLHHVTLPDPAFRSRYVMGSSHGWLITADDRSNLILVNPMTGDQIAMPPPETMPNVELLYGEEDGIPDGYSLLYVDTVPRNFDREPSPYGLSLEQGRFPFYTRVALSCDPSSTENCIVIWRWDRYLEEEDDDEEEEEDDDDDEDDDNDNDNDDGNDSDANEIVEGIMVATEIEVEEDEEETESVVEEHEEVEMANKDCGAQTETKEEEVYNVLVPAEEKDDEKEEKERVTANFRVYKIDFVEQKLAGIEGGDIFDCIDVNLQPAFNHPFLKDHKIQMEPSSFPVGMDVKSVSPHNVSQAQPPLVACPRGTIPMLRNHISPRTIIEVNGEDKQQEAVGIQYGHDDIYGTRAIINVYEPKVKNGSKDYTTTSIDIYSKPGLAEAIGVGYSVSPRLSGDSFARFHVAWDHGELNKPCYDHTCPGFVQVSHNFGLGGRLRQDPRTKNWWVIYGEENTPVGYWPNSLFNYIRDNGDTAFWGGHVSGPTASTDSPQIGSGHFASEGYGKAAFIKNIQLVDKNNKLFNPGNNKAVPGSTRSSKFTVDGYGVDKYGLHTYYGGPGDLA
ncbi:hypothetical protein ACQ4PT_053834 [Festuca glaucescens]